MALIDAISEKYMGSEESEDIDLSKQFEEAYRISGIRMITTKGRTRTAFPVGSKEGPNDGHSAWIQSVEAWEREITGK